MEPRGFGQQPVQADDGQPRGFCLLAERCTLSRGDIGDERSESKGGNLQTLVANPRDEVTNPSMVPVLECLVADGIVH